MLTFTKWMLLHSARPPAPSNRPGGRDRPFHRHDTAAAPERRAKNGRFVRGLAGPAPLLGLCAALLTPIGCGTPDRRADRSHTPDATTPAEATRDGASDDAPAVRDWPSSYTPVAVERARWRDVDAAVSAAASAIEVAVERVENTGAFERVYHLVGVRAEPGYLRVASPPLPDPDDMTAIDPRAPSTTLECRIGRFGEPARESKMIEQIRAWRPRHRR